MNFLIYFLQRTIGQKIIVGLSGMGLCLFVFVHMLGNLFILSGHEAYNSYAHKLHKFPFFVVLELGLLAIFLGHILLSLLLQFKNKKAKGNQSYLKKAKGEKKVFFAHQFLAFQAGILITFLVFHLKAFKYGTYYETSLHGERVRDIYLLAVETFKNPFYTVGYSFVLFILSIHLLRGLPASFKSLGLNHPVYISFLEKLSWVFVFVVIFGFLAPIWYILLVL